VLATLRRGRRFGVSTEVIVLAIGMALSIALILWQGRGTTLFADDYEYWAHLLKSGGDLETPDFGLNYAFAPFNGHLQVVGKVIYEAMFAVFGSDYLALRVLEAALWALCVGLFFALASPLIGAGVALAGSVLLLFLGSGWEAMLWAFDLHTLVALAAGLAALLVLRRGGKWSDPIACALLLLAVGSIELGLAFVAGIGVGILLRPDRWRRIWVAAVPIVAYVIWTAWASQFEQQSLDLVAMVRAIVSIPSSLSVTVASLTGLVDPNGPLGPEKLGSTFEARLIAVLLAVVVVRRLARGSVNPETWVTLTVLLAFWAFVAIGVRPTDQSRYVFPEALLLLLVLATMFAGARVSRGWLAVVWVFVALALPTNLAFLADGREAQVEDAIASRSEYAMFELARANADPDYLATNDGRVAEAWEVPFTSLTASQYLSAADRYGGIGYSLAEVEELDPQPRLGADATLVGVLGLKLVGAAGPSDRSDCAQATGTSATPDHVEVPVGGALVRATGPRSAALALERFSGSPDGVPIGRTRGDWRLLEIPPDSATQTHPWTLIASGSVEVCPAP
jgi:hypothetical protein